MKLTIDTVRAFSTNTSLAGQTGLSFREQSPERPAIAVGLMNAQWDTDLPWTDYLQTLRADFARLPEDLRESRFASDLYKNAVALKWKAEVESNTPNPFNQFDQDLLSYLKNLRGLFKEMPDHMKNNRWSQDAYLNETIAAVEKGNLNWDSLTHQFGQTRTIRQLAKAIEDDGPFATFGRADPLWVNHAHDQQSIDEMILQAKNTPIVGGGSYNSGIIDNHSLPANNGLGWRALDSGVGAHVAGWLGAMVYVATLGMVHLGARNDGGNGFLGGKDGTSF